MAIEEEIDSDVRALETCNYTTIMFAEVLLKIQKAVDDLSLHQYSNLPQWVAKLDEEVGGNLNVQMFISFIWYKKKKFVSCNKALSFYIATLKFFLDLPTAFQHKTCMRQTFFEEMISPKKYRKQTIIFLGLRCVTFC